MKIKVVHVLTKLEFGGAQQNTLYTVGHLDPARFEPVLVCGRGGILDAEAERLSGNPAHPFRLKFFSDLVRPVHPLRDLAALVRLARFLRAERPEIVHTHSSKAGILGRIAARLAGVPVILHTYHGFGFHERQRAFVRCFFAALERLCCRLSARIIFVSEENRRTARRYRLVRDGQEVLIRSGVDLGALPARVEDKAEKKASLGCRMHKPMVVSVGNLKPQKNPEGFVRVAARCLKEIPECSFVFIGGGESKSRLEAQVIARGLHDKIMFLGWRRDAAEILAAADLFILTSLWEGLPRALVEAMKSGLCCACYAVDGVRDVIRDGETGFLVEPGDEGALADRVVRLLQDPKLAKSVGERAAASIGPEFDIGEMVRRQEALYSGLVAAAPPTSTRPRRFLA